MKKLHIKNLSGTTEYYIDDNLVATIKDCITRKLEYVIITEENQEIILPGDYLRNSEIAIIELQEEIIF